MVWDVVSQRSTTLAHSIGGRRAHPPGVTLWAPFHLFFSEFTKIPPRQTGNPNPTQPMREYTPISITSGKLHLGIRLLKCPSERLQVPFSAGMPHWWRDASREIESTASSSPKSLVTTQSRSSSLENLQDSYLTCADELGCIFHCRALVVWCTKSAVSYRHFAFIESDSRLLLTAAVSFFSSAKCKQMVTFNPT